MKELKDQTHALAGQSRIVSRTLIAQERVRAVYLMPGVSRAHFLQARP